VAPPVVAIAMMVRSGLGTASDRSSSQADYGLGQVIAATGEMPMLLDR
jgi:hypothetical protein